MDQHQVDAAQETARRSAGKRPSRAQWHLLGPAFGCAIAIVATTPTGSGSLLASKEQGEHSAETKAAKTRSASAPCLYRPRNLIERFFNKTK